MQNGCTKICEIVTFKIRKKTLTIRCKQNGTISQVFVPFGKKRIIDVEVTDTLPILKGQNSSKIGGGVFAN